MWHWFVKGGPVMWPLLAASLVSLSVVLERCVFLWRQRRKEQPGAVKAVLRAVEAGNLDEAVAVSRRSEDPVTATLLSGIAGKDQSLSHALLVGAGEALAPFNRGITALDTIVTLAPLLGLLGTVTGMIRAFGLLGEHELGAPVAITGGVAEALIATAFGLAVAIWSLIPLNVLCAYRERVKRRIELAGTALELLLAPESSRRLRDEDPIYRG